MISRGDYSNTLRSLGQFLEGVDATEIGIVEHEEYLEVSWRNKRGDREERYHEPAELAQLRTLASMYRGKDDRPRYGLAELLRTMGQELDALLVQGVAIAETPDGFHSAGRVNGSEVSRTYTRDELIQLAQRYRRKRAP